MSRTNSLCAVGAVLALGLAAAPGRAQQPADPPRWTLSEELVIKSDEGSSLTQLTPVMSVAVLSDGTIVTAHRQENLLRLYSSSGTLLRTIGRSGQGPGEFAGAIGSLGIVHDTIWVYETRTRRLSFFLANGTHVRTVTPPNSVEGRSCSFVAAVGDGALFCRSSYLSGMVNGRASRAGSALDSVLYLVLGRDGATRVAKQPAEPADQIPVQADGYNAWIYQPFIPRDNYAVAADGGSVVVLGDPVIYGGDPGTLRVFSHTSSGERSERSLRIGARRLTAAETNRFRNQPAVVDPTMPPERRAELNAMVESIRKNTWFPEFAPLAQAVRVGRDGSVWIRQAVDSSTWLVTDGESIRARVTVPLELRVMVVSADHIWALRNDADGLPQVVRLRAGRN